MPEPAAEVYTGQPDELGGGPSLPRPSGNRTVTLAMFVSFGTFLLAGPAGIAKLTRVQRYLVANPAVSDPSIAPAMAELPTGGGSGSSPGGGAVLNAKSIFGWAALFVMLTVLADFEATSELAGSFAMLIMLTTLLALGPDALATIGRFSSGVTNP